MSVPTQCFWLSGDVARVWKTLAAAEEVLNAEVFSLGELGVDVNRQGSLGDFPVLLVMEEIMAVVQEEEKLVPQKRVQQAQAAVGRALVPQFLEETVEVLTPTERGATTDCRRAKTAGVGRDSRGGQIVPA